MITAIIFILVLGVLILVHELGHFVMAKHAGMVVEEFGFGFPPTLWSKKMNGTKYSINAIPFGGYVKILGEDGDKRDLTGSFASKSIWSRFLVIVAGVVMNFLLAVALLIIVNIFGLRVGVDGAKGVIAKDLRVQIIQISAKSPAEFAGIKLLDQIVSFQSNGVVTNIKSSKDVQDFVVNNKGKTVNVEIARGRQTMTKSIEIRTNPPAGEGSLGISLATTGVITYPWYEALWRGIYDASILLVNTVMGYYLLFKTLFVSGKLMSDVSGPIGIATLTGSAARLGFNYLAQFVAMISVNLAVLNFIPFPALDGGRAILLLIEKIKCSPINKKIEGRINAVGFSLLIILMFYVTFRDILKFF